MTRLTPFRAALATSVAVAAFLWWLAARRYLVSNDEGIFLEGALRILHGQVPYRDFFLLMGPGTFWLEALALKTFGVSLAASRVVTIADLSVIAGCVCWLLARWSNPAWAISIALVSILLEVADPAMTEPNHRIDSAAFAIAAATLLVLRADRAAAIAAGALAGFAAWMTPSVILVPGALLAWLWIAQRPRFLPFLSGCGALSICCGAALAFEAALAPMLEQMWWTAHNYGGANFMPYGSRFGGYASFFEGSSGADIAPRVLVLLALSMPAILPPFILFLTRAASKNGEVLLVTIAAFALLASAYPRFDVPHLTYAAPLFYALAGFHLIRATPGVRVAVFGLACLLAAIPAGFGVFLRTHMIAVDSRAGRILAMPADAEMIRELQQRVPAGARLFCYPYLPMFYFLTLGENPTRFSYLQPGMMSEHDEETALAELRARPPERVLYQDVTPEMILRIWPNSDRARLRLNRIEAFLKCGYRPVGTISYNGIPVRVLEYEKH